MLLKITPGMQGRLQHAGLVGWLLHENAPLGTWVLTTLARCLGRLQSIQFYQDNKMASLATAYLSPPICQRHTHFPPQVDSGLTTTLHILIAPIIEEETEAGNVK